MPPSRLPAEVLMALGLVACGGRTSVDDVSVSACLDTTAPFDTGPVVHDSGPCLDLVEGDTGDSGDTGSDDAHGPSLALIDRLTDLPADVAARLRKRCSNQ